MEKFDWILGWVGGEITILNLKHCRILVVMDKRNKRRKCVQNVLINEQDGCTIFYRYFCDTFIQLMSFAYTHNFIVVRHITISGIACHPRKEEVLCVSVCYLMSRINQFGVGGDDQMERREPLLLRDDRI